MERSPYYIVTGLSNFEAFDKAMKEAYSKWLKDNQEWEDKKKKNKLDKKRLRRKGIKLK